MHSLEQHSGGTQSWYLLYHQVVVNTITSFPRDQSVVSDMLSLVKYYDPGDGFWCELSDQMTE